MIDERNPKQRVFNTVMNSNDKEGPRDEESSTFRKGIGDDFKNTSWLLEGVKESC